MQINTDGRIIRGTISLILFALFIASFFLNPLKYNLNRCGFKEMTGYSCPSCGLTRSFFSVSHLHIGDAFSFHLLGPVIYLFFILLALRFGYEAATGNRIQISIPSPLLKISLFGFSGIWLIYWIIKVIMEMGML
jgi:hypothetical protein